MNSQPEPPPADEGDDGQSADERRGELPPEATPVERLVGEPLRRLARQNGRQVEP